LLKKISQLKKNFIFDLDGTLWDTVDPCTVAWNKALIQIGLKHLQITENDLKAMVGHSQLQIFANLFSDLTDAQTKELQKSIGVAACEIKRL